MEIAKGTGQPTPKLEGFPMSDPQLEQLPAFKIHNRSGSVNLTLLPAKFNGETFTSREGEVKVLKKGCLMLEMANAAARTDSRGNATYDWANKITMKLADTDIQQIIAGLRGEKCQIIHDPNKARNASGDDLPKSRLQISKGERYGHFVTMSRGDNSVSCPLSDADAATLNLLLNQAITRIYGW
jgi:hypothetical protein